MVHPVPVPMHLAEQTGIVYIDEGLAPLTPVGFLLSSGTTISGALDHGSLAGLDDDDHPHYTLVDGSRFFTDNTGTTVNQLFDPPDLDEYITRAYLESVVTSGVAGVTLLNSRSGIIDIVGSGIINVSVDGQEIIVSAPNFVIPNALIGVNGITVISGSNVTTISGFRDEFVSSSGSLQTQIDALDDQIFVPNALIGVDGITVISGTDVTTISGFRQEFVSASGALALALALHAVDASAHHARYTDGEAIAATEPARIALSGALSAEIDADIAAHAAISDAHHEQTVINTTASGSGVTIVGTGEVFVSTSDQIITISGTPHDAAQVPNALVGVDGITVISGANVTTISGFYGEFVSSSGSLQTQIDNIVIASGVTDVNSVAGSVNVVGAGEVFVTTVGQTITISGTPHITDTDTDTVSDAILGGVGITVTSGVNTTTIDGHLRYTKEENDAILGLDGVTIISGTNTITVSGFYTEFVNASGSLQTQIDNITIASGVTDVNSVAGSVVIEGAGEVFVTTSGQTITVSGTPHEAAQVPNALIGEDGITIISGSSTTTVSGFYAEFVSTSGSLQEQIDDIDAGEPAIVGGVGITVTSGTNITTIDGHLRYTSAENPALVGVGEVVVSSGVDVIVVSGTPHTPVPDALAGVDGITVISGTNITTISGFQSEFVSASGSLQVQIDNITTASGVSSVNSIGGDIEIVGKDQVVVTTEGQTIVVSGLPTETDVDSINTVTGTVTVEGAGEVFVTTAGQTITISGTPHTINTDTVSDAIVGVDGITIISGANTTTVSGFRDEFVSASGSLQSQIDGIDVDEIEPAIVGGVGITVTSGVNTTTIDGHGRYTSAENDAIIGAGEVVVISGTNTITISGTPHTINTDTISDAIVGVDGITVISGTDTTTVSGFYTEFTSASGSLQSQIDAIEVDEIEPAIVGGVGITVTSGSSTTTIDGHLRYTKDENDAIIGAGEVVVISGANTITVSGTPHTVNTDTVSDALEGVDGITVISGTSITTISGFRSEFVSASGSLQTQIDAIEVDEIEPAIVGGVGITVTSGVDTTTIDGHLRYTSAENPAIVGAGEVVVISGANTITVSGTPHTENTDTVSDALVGVDGITIISGTNTTTVSGFYAEFTSASGSLQSQIDNIDVDEIEPAIVGANGITVISGGNTITIVDGPDDTDVDAIVVSGTTITGTVEFRGVHGVALHPNEPSTNIITVSGTEPTNLLNGPLLRVDFLSNGNVLNEWLFLSDATTGPSNETPYVCIFPCRIAALGFTNSSAGVGSDIEIYKALDGAGATNSLVFTWEVRNTRVARKTDFGLTEVTFAAGDKIAIFSSDPGGSDPDDLILTLYLEVIAIGEEEANENFSGNF